MHDLERTTVVAEQDLRRPHRPRHDGGCRERRHGPARRAVTDERDGHDHGEDDEGERNEE